MDETLKQRLVGAAVLVVLAVVFLPMVLDGPDQPSAPVPASIAAVPSGASTFRYDLNAPLPQTDGNSTAAAANSVAAGTAALPANTPVTTSKVAVEPASKPATAVTAAPKAAETKPVVIAKSPVEPAAAWAAQVGSFSKQATADGVAADLKAKGFKAFVMAHKDGKQTLYRVRVGPVASREAADALAKKITSKTGQTARPVPHP